MAYQLQEKIIRVRPIKDLSRLSKGIYKRWIWLRTEDFSKGMDYLEKVKWCIADLNSEIEKLSVSTMKEVIYVIVLVDWISEAVEHLPELFVNGVMDGFEFKRQDELARAKKYLKAIRSFVVAHPLKTGRHPDYGLDGDMICIDIMGAKDPLWFFKKDSDWYYLSYNGMTQGRSKKNDFTMKVYSDKNDQMKYFKIVGASYRDLYHVAELYIAKLYAITRWLNKQKKTS